MQFQFLAILFAVSVQAADIPASSSSAAPIPSQGISVRDQCLIGCGAGNIKCQASCDNLPNPTNDDVKKNTECIAKCNADNNLLANQPALLECYNSCSVGFNPTSTAVATSPSSSGKADKNSSKKPNGSNGSNSLSISSDPNSPSSNAMPIIAISSTFATLIGVVFLHL